MFCVSFSQCCGLVYSLWLWHFLFIITFLFVLAKEKRERELIDLFDCVVAFCVMCVFLSVLWVGLQSAIVAFPGHNHLLFSFLSQLEINLL